MSHNFTGPSRERVNFIFRNKTNAPEVGKYTPINTIIDKNVPKPAFDKDDKFSKKARQEKIERNFQK